LFAGSKRAAVEGVRSGAESGQGILDGWGLPGFDLLPPNAMKLCKHGICPGEDRDALGILRQLSAGMAKTATSSENTSR